MELQFVVPLANECSKLIWCFRRGVIKLFSVIRYSHWCPWLFFYHLLYRPPELAANNTEKKDAKGGTKKDNWQAFIRIFFQFIELILSFVLSKLTMTLIFTLHHSNKRTSRPLLCLKNIAKPH